MADAFPQTEPGVPAPGTDPVLADLNAMQTADHVWDWLGSHSRLRVALARQLGGGDTISLRDVVYVTGKRFGELATAGPANGRRRAHATGYGNTERRGQWGN